VGGAWNNALSDRVVATAEAAAQDLQARGIQKDKIQVILNGSLPIREVAGEELNAFRTRYRIAPTDFTVGISARLVPYKGHHCFLQAAKFLCEKAPQIPFRFLIAGEGELREKLEQTAHEFGIWEKVRFLGFLSDMAPFYRSLRLNVNCSHGTETSCLALSEGMSAGVPFLASRYGGNPAMLGDSHAGMLFSVGDAEELAEQILQIATDPALEILMGQAAKRRYEERYTAAKMTEEVTRLYEDLLDHRGIIRSKPAQQGRRNRKV
jgi:glycosyltransferase involved in cell wall biosynthesis